MRARSAGTRWTRLLRIAVEKYGRGDRRQVREGADRADAIYAASVCVRRNSEDNHRAWTVVRRGNCLAQRAAVARVQIGASSVAGIQRGVDDELLHLDGADVDLRSLRTSDAALVRSDD